MLRQSGEDYEIIPVRPVLGVVCLDFSRGLTFHSRKMGKKVEKPKEEIKFENIRDLVDNILMRVCIGRTWIEQAWVGSELDFQAYQEDMRALEGKLEDLQNMINEDEEYFK